MLYRKKILLLLFLGLTFQIKALEPERRAFDLLTVKDYRQAVLEADQVVKSNPNSKLAWEALIHAYAKVGDEKKLLDAWERFLVRFPEESLKRELLETISWGVIEKGGKSSSPIVRFCSVLGAFLGQDAKSVPILLNGLCDQNPQLRAISVQLAANFRDITLQEAIVFLLEKERNVQVRAEVIKAIGKMQIKGAENKLIALLSHHSSAEEKAAAIEALVNLIDTPEKNETMQLISSNRAGLRELACQVASYTLDKGCGELLFPLLQDSSSSVRCSAVQSLGLLRLGEKIYPLTKDPDPQVAISSCWAMMINDPDAVDFHQWLTHPNKEVRRFASGALAATGRYGVSQMLKEIDEVEDPFVKVNLSLGLIAQREDIPKATRVLSDFLENTSEMIVWNRQGHIKYLTVSQMKYHPLIPNLPESTNQLTRLELLNVLAMIEDPLAPVLVRNFLKKRSWGVTGLASALLLTEGDDQSLEIVEELLTDSDQKIRVQAALILALWGRGENAINVLQEAYTQADREMKERILEGLGQVGSETSIPFLVSVLKDPSQTLRIIASASLLKCLYH